MSRASTVSAVALALVIAVAAGLRAVPQNQTQQVPRFRTGVEAVVVDVSVLDRDRRPVRELTVADFTVLEDGVPQPITSFTAVDLPDVVEAQPRAAWVREVAPDVRRNDEFKQGRLVVLVMDDATPMPAPDVLRAKNVARRAINALGPDDMAALVFPLRGKDGVDFTRDRLRLLAAVDKYNGNIDSTVCDRPTPYAFDEFNPCAATLFEAMIACLTDVAEDLTALPERRKALMFVSVGMPLDPEEGAPKIQPGDGNSNMHTEITRQLITRLIDAFRAAQGANVAIYPLDPGGLRAPHEAGVRSVDESNPARLNREFLRAAALNTGGFAVTDTNDADAGISQILMENGSYYLIGYVPASSRAEGKFRRIQVRVNRPGVTVRARNGYYEKTPDKQPARTAAAETAASLKRSIEGLVPQGDVALQVTAAPFAMEGTGETAVGIVVRLTEPVPPGADRAVENVGLEVNAYDTGGKRRGAERLDARMVLRPTSSGEASCELLSRLDLKPGRYQLRIGATSAARQKTGSVFYDLDVPDFSKGTLGLSGAVLNVTPNVAVAPKDKLAPLIPLIPTSLREFGNDDKVTAFVRVYQPGSKTLAPVAISVTLVDASGAKIVDKQETLDAARFGESRAADYRVELPVAGLSRGPHLLTIEATAGKNTIRRQVRFAMK